MAITFSMTPDGDIINDHHLIAQVLREALPYIDFLKGKTLVIKLISSGCIRWGRIRCWCMVVGRISTNGWRNYICLRVLKMGCG